MQARLLRLFLHLTDCLCCLSFLQHAPAVGVMPHVKPIWQGCTTRPHQQSTALESSALGLVAASFGSISSFVSEKVMSTIDRKYLGKCLYLPPCNGTSPVDTKAVIILFPGIGLTPEQYNDTARSIQDALYQTYGLNTYFVVAKFFKNFGYLPNEPDRRLRSILAELSRRGVPGSLPVGVIGHSGGAFLAYDTALTNSQAFVHMGCTINSKGALPWTPRSLEQYPKPLLTLLGEMDGYIRFTGGALEFAEMEGLRQRSGFEHVIYEKPVVVLPGISHEQMADGTQSKPARMSGRRDLAPYRSIQEAHRDIGHVVAAFLALHLSRSESTRPEGRRVIERALEETRRLSEPYLRELTPEAEEDFIKWAQAEVASVEGVGKSGVRVQMYTGEPEFVYSKPVIDQESSAVHVCVRKQTDVGIKLGFTKQISPSLSLKMKRQEAVVTTLSRQPSKRAPTAMELNRKTYKKAIESLSEEQKQRFDRYGRKLEFLDDDEITYERGGGPGWVATPLKVEPVPGDPSRATVRSPVLYTPVDALPRFAGMAYMKLLTAAQAYEWCVHDAYVTPS